MYIKRNDEKNGKEANPVLARKIEGMSTCTDYTREREV